MNAARRGRILALNLPTVLAELESIRDDEQESLEAMPESLQSGERGEHMQENIDAIEEAIAGLESMIETVH